MSALSGKLARQWRGSGVKVERKSEGACGGVIFR